MAPFAPPAPLPPQTGVTSGVDTSIDWVAQARRAAAAVTSARSFREFSRNPRADFGQGDSQPRGDLFKDLPAYQKYHPQ
ncbi:MAG: hypothetical protein ACRETG_04020 [Steroidobacteraceae bacterium]